MDILLTQSYLIERDPPEKEIMRPFPPLGIMFMASFLKERGFDVELHDNTFEPDLKRFEQIVSEHKPKLVGISAVETSRKTALEMCSIAKRHGCRVVAGGCDPSNDYESYLSAGADWICVGEGENTVVELAGFVIKGNPDSIHKIPGLYFKKESELEFTGKREMISDLNSIPFPEMDENIINPYLQAWREFHNETALAVMSSRGCPHSCTWCSRNVFGRTLRCFSASRFVEQLDFVKEKFNPDYFWFADDSLTSSFDWLFEFQSELSLQKIKITYECLGRVDEITPQKARILADTGCRLIWFGAESGSERILNAMKKGFDIETIQRARNIMKDVNIPTGFFIMLGYPPEDIGDIRKTVKLIKETAPDKIGVSIAYPIAGTDFHKEMTDKIISNKWESSGENRPIFKTLYPPVFYKFARRLICKHAQIAQRNSKPLFLDRMKLFTYSFGMSTFSLFKRSV